MNELRSAMIESIRAAAERERPLLGRLDEPARESGAWSVKDHVAHLAAWRREACAMLEALRRGEPRPPIPDFDSYNAVAFERYRDWPAERVREEAEASYAALLAVLQDYPEATLLAKRPGTDSPAWVWVPANGHEHVADHLAMLAAQAGDPAAADAAQLWAHEVGVRLPGNAARCDYNLGCHYARAGRREEAIPLLRRAVAADARLREYAQHDPDLEGLRELVIL